MHTTTNWCIEGRAQFHWDPGPASFETWAAKSVQCLLVSAGGHNFSVRVSQRVLVFEAL
jgi:hypothetical protein